MTVRLQSTFFVLLTIFIFSFLLLPDDAHAQQPATTHTVQAGETLFSVARQYDLAVGDLRRWNDLDSDNLSVGQVLKIAPPKAENQITHTVKTEETTTENLAEMMVGREVLFEVGKKKKEPGKVVLSVNNLKAKSDRNLMALNGASFELREGEILGKQAGPYYSIACKKNSGFGEDIVEEGGTDYVKFIEAEINSGLSDLLFNKSRIKLVADK